MLSLYLSIFGVVLGVVLRIQQYASNWSRSLWLDEAMLALNLVNRSFEQLRMPLDYLQGAPLGFLYIQKLMILFGGPEEYVFRFFPFLSSILAVIMFYKVSQFFLEPETRPLAIGLFAISPIALVQCTQAKQYSTEMLVALCLYLLYHYIYSKKLNASRGILFGIAGGVIVWFSFSAVFFMAPLLLVLIIFPNNKNDRSDYFWLCFISTIWMLSALVHFSLVHALLSNANRALSEGLPGLFRAHPELLIGFPPTKTGLSLGLVTPLRDLLDVKYKYVSFCVLILGFTSIWRRRKDLFIVLIIPPIEVFLLSMLKIYPTGYTRYVIFLLPAFLFATAEGVEYAVKLIHVKYIPVKLLIVAFILFTPLQRAIGVIRSNPYQHDMKSVLSYVNDHRLRSDKIYVYYKSVPAFLFYAPQYGIKQEDYIKGIGHPPHLEEDRKDILRVNDYERSWVVFSDVPFEKEKYFLSQLDGIKKETDSFHAVGASAYLYD